MPEQNRPIRAADAVRVRSKEEILATLDEHGRLDGLPFMPEMLAFADQELRVYKRADKTCDTITPSHAHRRLDATVHLVGARCDGSAHGGCQAACLLFFRQDWLTRPDGSALPESTTAAPPDTPATTDTLDADTRAPSPDDEPRYRCQATELLNASSHLSPYQVSQYVTDVRTGNERTGTVVKGLAIVVFNKYQRLSRKLPAALRINHGEQYPWLRGTGPGPAAPPPLNLRPGELVEIRGKDEILRTLRPKDNKNRGMAFDVEMLPYLGKRARVLARVERIIDENTGRMLRLRDCIILQDVFCRSYYHRFCPRAIYPYWREQWLRRVPDAES